MVVCELDRHLVVHRLEEMEREQRSDELATPAEAAEVARIEAEVNRRQVAMGELQAHLVELEIAAPGRV